MQTTKINRIFKFKHEGVEMEIEDPSPNYTPSEVVNLLSNQYPSLLNSVVKEEGVIEGKLVYSLNNTVGTKG